MDICALTMVRNDDFFLQKWVDHYAAHLGKENLFVYLDGEDQSEAAFLKGCNTIRCRHIDEPVRKGDKRRANFLSAEARRLMQHYDMAIGTDVDEFLAVDPALGLSLKEFLKLYKDKEVISALGIDVGQDTGSEGHLDLSRPFLAQRRYGIVHSRYTKASVITTPCRWGSGFHRVRHKNYFIAPGLYLFHFGGADFERLKLRMESAELHRNGWQRHLNKRAATIRQVDQALIHNNIKCWDKTIPLMRNCEQYCRPVFAWNKPTSFGIIPVVEIPERFKKMI